MNENDQTNRHQSPDGEVLQCPPVDTRVRPCPKTTRNGDSTARLEPHDLSPSALQKTIEYWRNALSDCECVPFPVLPPSAEQPSTDTVTEYQLPPMRGQAVEASTVFHAAWALVIGRRTNSKDVVFGATTTTRPGAGKGAESKAATVPVRIKLPGHQRVSEYLKTVQQQATDRGPHEKVGLETIGKTCAAASTIQTQLVMQRQQGGEPGKGPVSQGSKGFALVLKVHLGVDEARITALSDSSVIQLGEVRKLLQQLGLVVRQLEDAGGGERISDIKLVTPEDLERIWDWNSTVPASVHRCVHDIITERTAAQPEAPAICAWDGGLTYSELDRVSTALAGRLIDLGVQKDTMVPLCFEKSLWTTVAMLGVIKAGGAFVLLDASLPEARLRSITQQARATIIVSLHSNEALSLRLAPQVVTLGSHDSKDLFDGPSSRLCLPTCSPSSAMYVAFTSGSTGTPKGAVISHGNLASALHHQREGLTTTAESRVYDFSSYSFDVSICNAFATLATGGCLCVPNEQDRRDRLAESIASLDANVIDVTPSVARLLALEQVPGLRTIIFGGEALYLRDVTPWWDRVQIVSLYGPCECTPNSTINRSPRSPEEATNMGRGVGLVTWVVDADNDDSLCPLGCVGELLLEGPLVGQGYLDDPEKTAAAFIEDPLWLLQGAPGRPGRHGRLYKTGDLVRYNEDGSLTFSGRKDAQVKIRGQRVELGEIEHLLRSHQGVEDAVAVLQQDERQEAWISSFVTVGNDEGEGPANGEEKQHIEVWEKQFDEDYVSFDSIRPETIGRDFLGWTSMYDGSDIDKAEMDEWLDETIETMLNGSRPGHVLEIGTGSGMMLFNLTPGLQSYIGLEPSGRAVEFVTKAARSVRTLRDRVKMFKATAADLGRVKAALSPELAVLNSVVQYFPSQDYLFNVVRELVQLKGVQTLFFGDIRSLALFKEFLVARALHIAGEDASKDDVGRIMADLERAESEFLVDAAFFTALPSRLSQVQHVEILPKKMRATNELSAFRYAAVVHVKKQPVFDIGQNEWTDFKAKGLDAHSLLELLRDSSSSTIAISNIPHSKSVLEGLVIRALDSQESVDNGNWLASARREARQCSSLSAADLAELAARAGYRVETSWARQHSQRGGLDAIFHRQQPTNGAGRVMFRFPDDHEDPASRPLCSEPLRQQLRQKTQDQLHEMLESRLPSYMVPRDVQILDKMPLNGNGKIDRRALAKICRAPRAWRGLARQPGAHMSETERQVREIWGKVLNVEPAQIGHNDSFFQLGGNSIAVMKVVSEARRAGLELTVANLFCHPELHDVVRLAGGP